MSELPRAYLYQLAVDDADVDVLGHASNLVYLRWVQEAALAHSEAVGLGFDDYKEKGGVFVVTRHEIDYLRPAFRGDALQVRTEVVSMSSAQSVRETEIARTSDASVLAKARTTWGYVGWGSGRPQRIPEDVSSRFGDPPRVLPRRPSNAP
jgi:acyl-CoA thioester hydrolase